MTRTFLALLGVAWLLIALGCSNGSVRAAAPPPPAVVEVASVIQKDVPLEGERVGTLEGYVNAQIQPQVSGYLIRQDYHKGAFVKKGQQLLRSILVRFRRRLIKPKDNWPRRKPRWPMLRST